MNNPTAIILALEYYVSDNWYGKNYRVVLSPDGNVGFNTIAEAKKHRGAGPSYSCTNLYRTVNDIKKV